MSRTPSEVPHPLARVTKLLDPVTSGPPLPSSGVLAVLALTLLCIALAVALVLASSEVPVAYEATASAGGTEPSTALLPTAPGGSPMAAGTSTVSLDSLRAAYPAEPQPIPTALLTQIEDAESSPLPIEVGHLLVAVQTGFGDRSAQIEPTLRPYLFRVAGRLSVRTDTTLRVAVTAPDLDLARARAAALRRILDVAGVSDARVAIGAGVGPHRLSLVSE